ncbi:cytidine deaminase [Entomortierella parvispora]|uniref:Cytidine deaminase n=1 Tax=Entomortierella parvispora TaxID=205924 RepID=A0A9P3M046_9FUNG|nr:cytidine deaminase [Entomortierella parvispora]
MSALSNDQIEDLISQSLEARNNSYSPYSKFRVGAALRTVDGKIFQGCNVENASYGGAICAERTAFVKAVSEGYRRFVAIAVSCDMNQFISPCGICRQFMNEFGKNLEIFFVNDDRTYKRAILADLLPYAFGPEDLPGN